MPDITTLGPIAQVGQAVRLLVRRRCFYLESHC